MAIAARYVNRELLLIAVALTAVLLFVTIGARFISYLQDAALGKYPASSVLVILGYRLPGFLQLLLPFAWYLALLLTLGRLHAEAEFAVLRGGGVGPVRVLRWVAPSAVLVAVIVGYFSLFLAPDNDQLLTRFVRDQQANPEFSTVTPGVFRIYRRGGRVTYAEAVTEDGRSLEDVFMAELPAGDDVITVRAAVGGQEVDPVTGTHYLVLENGHRHQGTPGEAGYQVVSFGRLRQRLESAPPITRFGIEAVATRELREREDAEALAELHFRIALPLVVIIATLVGIGVSRTRPRDGRFSRILPGLALFVAYYALIVFNRNAISDGHLPPAVGLWGVHAVFLACGLMLMRASSLPARA
jgi:lipopolysaccharide export system permease protein